MNCQDCPKHYYHHAIDAYGIMVQYENVDFCTLWNKDVSEVTEDECGVKEEAV